MFPYLEQPVLRIGGATFYAFGMLVTAAVVLGCWLVLRRAERHGIDPARTTSLLLWVLAVGFLISHLDYLAFAEPWLFTRLSNLWVYPGRWLNLWSGMSSFGGITGGVLGGWLYMRKKAWPARERWFLLEAVAFAFPFAWSVARFGCYLAHDHPGIRTASWLAVRYPDGPRYDLGLLDCFLGLALAGLFLYLDQRPRPRGFYLITFLLLYGPARLLLDNLRVEERFLGLTSGQHGALVAIFVALATLRVMKRQSPAAAIPTPR